MFYLIFNYIFDLNLIKFNIRQYVITDILNYVYTLKFPLGVIKLAGEKFTIYMDADLKKTLRKVAVDEEKSASEIITELVKNYLKNKGIKFEIKKD